jgi:hypothetical protein
MVPLLWMCLGWSTAQRCLNPSLRSSHQCRAKLEGHRFAGEIAPKGSGGPWIPRSAEGFLHPSHYASPAGLGGPRLVALVRTWWRVEARKGSAPPEGRDPLRAGVEGRQGSVDSGGGEAGEGRGGGGDQEQGGDGQGHQQAS